MEEPVLEEKLSLEPWEEELILEEKPGWSPWSRIQ
jgi:hypothetical protein